MLLSLKTHRLALRRPVRRSRQRPGPRYRGLALIALLFPVCCSPRTTSVASAGASRTFRLELPASLERQRSYFEGEIAAGLDRVAEFFRSAGFDLARTRLIDSAVVFETTAKAREYLSTQSATPLDSIPETFAGTVDGERLFLVSRESYRESWRALYKEWPWTDATYRQLIVHELEHRAHEAVAISRYGSAEAMGPTWFFEGLAVACAGQFESDQPLMDRDQILQAVGAGRTPPVSYPLYGQLVRSLAAEFGVKALVAHASHPGFPERLWSGQALRKPKQQ